LGCGYGVISRQLKLAQNCSVVGIEYDEQSAAHARPWLEQLIVADLDRSDWLSGISGKFEAILAADVIEHLRDPAALLHHLRGLLAEDGALILSVPNLGHAGVIAELLCGRFEYKETGILDETHLRFYTWQTVEAQLNSVGFEVTHREPVNAPGSHEQFFEHWVKLPAAMREMLSAHPLANVFQYVLKARRSDDPRPFMTDDDTALNAWLNRA
jgi:predicted TPR repeat methyltransferase